MQSSTMKRTLFSHALLAPAALALALAFTFAPEARGGDVIEFIMTIDSAQEVPPTGSPATGFGTATLNTKTNLLSWHIEFSGLSAAETGAHFHGSAVACANAGIRVDLGLGSPKIGAQVISQAFANEVMTGRWYVNIHSTNHPGGEIRGQVYPAPLVNPIPDRIKKGAHRIGLEVVASGLTAPNWGATAPGVPGRLYVTDQDGLMWNIDLASNQRALFLDVSDRIVDLGVFGPGTFDERGLLGVAFHPDYQSNGLLYTYTSEPLDGTADFSTMPSGVNANHQSVILEWEVLDPGDPDAVVDPNSAREILRIDQPQFNHNGGGLNFGPDGMLYISLGDGGGADDFDGRPFIGAPIVGHGCAGNGQNNNNPLGAVLRIDPLGNNSGNGQYGIPADNPFVGMAGLDENFAFGFRNPWRFSFDTLTGELYVADVGQNDIEEINLVVPGGNYGWRHKEGTFYFIFNGISNGYVTDMPMTGPTDVIDPIAQYQNPDDGIAIIGGFVYRGTRMPGLEGRYIFGDWSTAFAQPEGRLFLLDEMNGIEEFNLIGMQDLDMFVLGFGQDHDGELYLLAHTTGTPSGDTGAVFRLVPTVRADLTDFEVVFGSHVAGGLDELRFSDGEVFQLHSQFGFAATEPNIVDVVFGATSPLNDAASIEVMIESRINNPGGTARVRMKNWSTEQFEEVAQYAIGQTMETVVFDGLSAENRVRAKDDRIELSVRHAVIATFAASGFESFFDKVRIGVD